MGHPFFETADFPWAHPLAGGFLDAVARGFDNKPVIVALFEAAGGLKTDLNTDGVPRDVWRFALTELTRQGKLRALCDELLKQPRPEVHAEVRKIMASVAVSQRLVLRGDGDAMMFLDRTELRGRVEALANERSAMKVLVVHGPKKSGRTWTRHLITETVAELSDNDVSLYYCEGIFGDVYELIEDLFDRVGAPDLKPATPDTTSEAWFRRVCSQLLLAAQRNKDNRRFWIVLDDLDNDEFGASRFDPRVRSLFDQFAMLMVNDPYRKTFRLVLLAWPDDKGSSRWKTEHYWIELTRAETIEARHVGEYLNAWAAGRGDQITEGERTRIIKTVLAEAVAAPAAARLLTLHAALLRETGQGG